MLRFFCSEKSHHTVCNITYCEKAAVWQSLSSVQAALPQDQYIHSCGTLVSQSSQWCVWRRGDRHDRLQRRKRRTDGYALSLCLKLSFLEAVYYIQACTVCARTPTQWMCTINLNYNVILRVIGQQQDSWPTEEQPAENQWKPHCKHVQELPAL